MTPLVVTWGWPGDQPDRGYWDQGLLEDLVAGRLWRVPGGPALVSVTSDEEPAAIPTGGAVMIVPGRYLADEVTAHRVARVHRERPWALLIVTGDEESLFPGQALTVDGDHAWWQMTPRPDRPTTARRRLGEGYPPWFPNAVAEGRYVAPDDPERVDLAFAGQVTHSRREAAVRALRRLSDRHSVAVHPSDRFTGGLPPATYAALMARTRVAPCPSGPATPSSFRAFEALEAGAVPVLDDKCPAYPQTGYWAQVLGDDHPVPTLRDWRKLGDLADALLADWPGRAARISAWWQGHKRRLAHDFVHDLADLGATWHPENRLADRITVVITTSPSPLHPSTDQLEQVVASVLQYPALAGCEILIAADGVRPEQAHLADAYDLYLHRVAWLCEHHWPNAWPVIAPTWLHQAGVMRLALAEVVTPRLLFLEHDTPLVGDVPWVELDQVVAHDLDLLRLYHEGVMPAEHRHLMADNGRRQVLHFVPVIRTAQWSQRPHLARTSFYRRVLAECFGAEARTMVEDVMHGVVDYAWRTQGDAGLERYRLGIYAPEGDMRRSGHLDGRGAEPKYGMVFAYDGDAPPGAPRATAERPEGER